MVPFPNYPRPKEKDVEETGMTGKIRGQDALMHSNPGAEGENMHQLRGQTGC